LWWRLRITGRKPADSQCRGGTCAGTFADNRAEYDGGGINSYAGTLTVTNSTFSGNIAINGFGGGIDNPHGSRLTVTNAILANGIYGGNCAGSLTDGGHNLESDGTCSVGPATAPMLAPGLANNGGPTQTIAIQATSPAINAGDESVCTAPPVNNLDQGGYLRPGAGATSCSIGTYEYNAQGPSTPTPTPCVGNCAPPSPTPSPTVTGAQCTGDCDGSGDVQINEIITCVNIALGTSPLSACSPCDANGDGQVAINEIITAVNNALNGCPAS
jgi:hypothetical protein